MHSSPLDVDLELTRTAPQLEAYARAVLTTYADRLSNSNWYGHSFSLARALDKFKYACLDVYRLDGVEDGEPDIRERLRVCVHFVTDLIELLEKHEEKLATKRVKPDKQRSRRDIYDQVAELMLEIIYNASGITKPWWPCWEIQHNTVWTNFFDRFRESKTRGIIGFKLRRLIYEEIIEFDKYTNMKSFKAARYLGICLNCMGIKFGVKSRRDRNTWPLKKVILGWVKKNYLSLHKNHPTVAEACLMGSITYDAENMQLVKTYVSYADRDPARDVLSLSE